VAGKLRAGRGASIPAGCFLSCRAGIHLWRQILPEKIRDFSLKKKQNAPPHTKFSSCCISVVNGRTGILGIGVAL
jgi:hypothetical protein